MRKRLLEIIERSDVGDRLSTIYDFLMMAAITASLVPLAFHGTNEVFQTVEIICTSIFVADYALRLLTADLKLGLGARSFFAYPFTPMAVVDLLSILPAVAAVNGSLRLLRILRLLQALRVFKFLRYTDSFSLIVNVYKKQRHVLSAVFTVAFGYILVSALILFNVEPDSFQTFLDAVYWATISLTTVGYGDFYPVTAVGKVITILSSAFGIAIIALPTGIITAGYLAEVSGRREQPAGYKKEDKS